MDSVVPKVCPLLRHRRLGKARVPRSLVVHVLIWCLAWVESVIHHRNRRTMSKDNSTHTHTHKRTQHTHIERDNRANRHTVHTHARARAYAYTHTRIHAHTQVYTYTQLYLYIIYKYMYTYSNGSMALPCTPIISMSGYAQHVGPDNPLTA